MKSKKQFKNETDRVNANPYLIKKLIQSRRDMKKGKGIKIPLEELWIDNSTNL